MSDLTLSCSALKQSASIYGGGTLEQHHVHLAEVDDIDVPKPARSGVTARRMAIRYQAVARSPTAFGIGRVACHSVACLISWFTSALPGWLHQGSTGRYRHDPVSIRVTIGGEQVSTASHRRSPPDAWPSAAHSERDRASAQSERLLLASAAGARAAPDWVSTIESDRPALLGRLLRTSLCTGICSPPPGAGPDDARLGRS